jgi:hypothetical protein
MFQKHYSDDVLLACRDGELSGRAKNGVEKHLESCWLCRSRQAELEQQIQTVAEFFQEQNFPGPGWVEQSQSGFLRWREQFERKSPHFHGLVLRPWLRGRRIATIAAIAAICLGALVAWSVGWRTVPAPADIIARSRVAERDLHQQPLCQVFRVEIAQIKPAALRHESRLTVWSEKDGRRFASRWEENGALKHGAWRPSNDRRYIYNPAVDSQLVRWSSAAKVVSIAELVDQGLDFEQMEAAFLRWLESHQWRPISLTSDLSAFTSQEGVTLTAERRRLRDGKQVLQLVARRETARFAVELTVQVDALNYLPRLQRIRFETPGRAAEFSLFVDRIQAIPPAQLAAALFEPDVHIGGREDGGKPGPPPGPRAPIASEMAGSILSISEQIAREVEVQYALHLVGACLGEQIDIVKRPSRRILVRAVVENEQRKAQLSAALRALPFVEVEIKSLSEALEDSPQRSPATGQSTDITIAGSELPVQRLLEDYFKQRYEPAEVPRQIAELANEVTSLSGGVLAEVWAIRRLAMEFPARRTGGLRGAPRWLLEKMLQDHTTAVRDKGNHLRETLQSVLPGPLEGEQEIPAAESGVAPDWPSTAVELLNAAVRMDRLTRGLFAGSVLPEEDPQTAAKELLGILSNLNGHVHNLESAILAEFRDLPAQPLSNPRLKGLATTESKKERKL